MSPPPRPPRRSIRRALSLSMVKTAVTLVFMFASITILSRLLTPAEIGIYSVAAGMVALIHMLRDFGISEYLVQEKQLDDTVIGTVFTVNLLIAWALAVGLFAASGLLGRFYGNAGVTQVLQVVSLVFVLMPFGTVTMAQLKREMEFGTLVKIQIAESVVRSCAVIALAFAGFSYMSMAWAAVIGIATMVAGCTLWGWRYRARTISLRHWRDVLHFGCYRTVADIARQVGEQSANLIIGRMLGMSAAGLYSRGYGVVNMYQTNIAGTIGSVAFPALAREDRETGTAPELYRKAMVYLTGISWPFFAAGTLLAFPVVRVLFGAQWDAAVPLMRWLCGAAILATLTLQCRSFLIAVGRVQVVTHLALQFQSLRIALTVAAAFHSLLAVAIVQVPIYAIALVLYHSRLRRYPPLAVGPFTKALIPSAAVALATCIAPAIVVAWPGLVRAHMVLALLLAMAGGGLGWWLALRALRHPLLGEVQRITGRFPRLQRILCG